MESVSSIIQSVQQDLAEINHDAKKSNSQINNVNRQRAQEQHNKRSELLQKKSESVGKKNDLKLKGKLIETDKWLSFLKNQIKSSQKELKNLNQQDQKALQQVMKILNDLDSIQTHSLNQNSEGNAIALSSQSANETDAALASAASTSSGKKSVEDMKERSHFDRSQRARERGIGNIKKQLSIMKAMKFVKLGLVVAGAAVSAFTGGVTASLLKAYLFVVDKITSLALGNKLGKTAQNQTGLEKAAQTQLEQQNEVLKQNQKAEHVENKTQDALEKGLVNK